MIPWLTNLAELLDRWADCGPVLVSEGDNAILVRALPAPETKMLVETLRQGGWTFDLEDRGENPIGAEDLIDEYAPFRVTARKPGDVAGPARRVTNTGFSDLLRQGAPAGSLRLARCESAFETTAFRAAPFGDEAPFEPRPVEAKPRRAVRESAGTRVVPEDIGQWLLRAPETMPWADAAFQVWARQAWPNLVRSLANEVEGDTVVFRGPPLVRLAIRQDGSTARSQAGFLALQKAAAWVYDNERELEMRHGLLAAELARSAPADDDAIGAVGRLAGPALESARIAYGLNLSQVSRDSLRALADLRKAISDETAKLADTTRGIAGSVATAVFAGAGVVLARLTTGTPSYALIGLACIPILYVGAVVLSGWKFVKVQRRIRSQWRPRLYVFLPDSDYEQMVEGPARDAEGAFRLASWLGLGISIALLAGIIWFVRPDVTRSQGASVAVPPLTTTVQQAAPVPSPAAPASPASPPSAAAPTPTPGPAVPSAALPPPTPRKP
jgi:hypothetical protein